VRRVLVVLLLLVALLGAAFFYASIRMPVREAGDAPQVLVVEPGDGVRTIGQKLHGLGLVQHPEVFRALVMARGDAGKLRAGEYALEGRLTLEQIVDKLVHGEVVRRTVTVPEGASLEDIVRLGVAEGLDGSALRTAAADPARIRDLDPEARNLEGYLFPDTYEITRQPGAATTLVQRMLQRFREVMAPHTAELAASGLTLREVVTLASLVERETALPEERPRIAAVFHNRLRLGMPLQTDPTVIYALRLAGRYDGNIRKTDLDIDSPYNTYRNSGLPPGPIASPGRASLLAALQPAPGKDLYFVSRNDGSHHFSQTLAEHQQAVNYYQRRRGTPPPARETAGPAGRS
jgi:peptidoglycan lytic transglycosylase G